MDHVTDYTLSAARKVIAVHGNYPGGEAPVGAVSPQPSYFLKPASSLALSGSSAERPAGCESLRYEGEIALIIGTPGRRIALADAWRHVQWVTAGNDLGLRDLRYADKGSNLRSKGGDGFTPIGPGLIPASAIDPTTLRVRTWHDDELVQDGRSADLQFPFARLIADLSQLITLETGDIILTGTPAGSAEVKPGAVVEVEVSTTAAGAAGASLTTGRLLTHITEGTTSFADFGARPQPEDSPETAPASPLTPELKAKLASVCTATLSSQLRKRGLNNVSIDGLTSTRPDRRIVGLARTLRYVPIREDLFKSHGGGFNAQKKAIDSVNDGEILVMEARGEKGTGTIGDILALRAQIRGAAAIITDGGVRDFIAVAAMDMPTYYSNPHPAVLGRRHIPWDADITIACGGATVQPGDIIVADADGILVIPPLLAEELAEDSITQEHEERFIAEMVQQGHSVDGLYPLNEVWRTRYEAWTADAKAGQRV